MIVKLNAASYSTSNKALNGWLFYKVETSISRKLSKTEDLPTTETFTAIALLNVRKNYGRPIKILA